MKIRKISLLLALSFGAILVFTGCKKDDGAIRSNVTINDIPTISTSVDATGSQAIDLLNLGSFSGKFKIALYFANATPPSKVDIVVRKNGSNANVKLYKAGVTTLPSTFTFTATELSTLFGAPIALGDSYDFAPDIYVGDRKFEAFPAVGAGSGAGPVAQPLYSEFARYAAICKFDPTFYVGNFTAKDAFGDADGKTIVLTNVDATHFSFIYPSVDNPKPIIVTVNATTNAVSIPLTVIGTQWSAPYGYPATATYANPSVNSATGSVTPCSRSVTLNIAWGTSGGSLTFGGGPYSLVLTKP